MYFDGYDMLIAKLYIKSLLCNGGINVTTKEKSIH